MVVTCRGVQVAAVSCTNREAAFLASDGQVKHRKKPRSSPDADFGIQVPGSLACPHNPHPDWFCAQTFRGVILPLCDSLCTFSLSVGLIP